jgi:transcriptional regulator with GAF, ATPase, and Fis domain
LDKQDNKKTRRLIRKLNKIRHDQAKKIDILCNDMVSAHRDFVKQLGLVNFTLDFYESLLGENDLRAVLNSAAEKVREHIVNSNVAIFLTDSKGFELHLVDENRPIDINAERLESYFTPEVVSNICRANRVCSLENMFEMGLVGNLSDLSSISAAAIPLGRFGGGIGFMLVYRGAEKQLTVNDLEKITTMAPGLCRAIEACHTLSNPEG